MSTTAPEGVPIRTADDVVRVRQEVRAAAARAGLSLIDQTKIVTAASELARNVLEHGGGGTARLALLQEVDRQASVWFSRIKGLAFLTWSKRSEMASPPARDWGLDLAVLGGSATNSR
jgi:hypothetical protein